MIRAGGGSPRDTLSVLDQLLAGAGGQRVTYPRALALLGATDVALIDDAVDALAAGDAAALFGAVESVVDAGHDPAAVRHRPARAVPRSASCCRRFPMPPPAAWSTRPATCWSACATRRHGSVPATLTRYAEVVHAGLGEMRGATAPRLLLEVVCARLLLPSASDTESALLQRVERIETRLDMSVPGGRSRQRSTAAKPARSRRPQPKPARSPPRNQSLNRCRHLEPEPAAARPRREPAGRRSMPPRSVRQWSTVRDKVRERSRTIGAMLADSDRARRSTATRSCSPTSPVTSPNGLTSNATPTSSARRSRTRWASTGRCDANWRRRSAGPASRRRRAAREEDSMLAEAEREPTADAPRRDPEEVALELLQNELGARRIDG